MAYCLSVERNTLLIFDSMWEGYEFLDLAGKFSQRNVFKGKKKIMIIEVKEYWLGLVVETYCFRWLAGSLCVSSFLLFCLENKVTEYTVAGKHYGKQRYRGSQGTLPDWRYSRPLMVVWCFLLWSSRGACIQLLWS